MEPRTSAGEQTPQAPRPEQWTMPSATEQMPGTPVEQRESLQPNAEQLSPAPQAEAPTVTTIPVTTALPAPVADDATTDTAASDDTPLVAADEDVIEKEWVDKAKKIISQTKDDPHQREMLIKKLQVEYIRRRYGREIGQTAD